MAPIKSTKLVWMDLEMTGLNPDQDEIIEIATIVTDGDLNVVEIGPSLVLNQPESRFEKMDDWNQKHHVKSGLWDKVLASNLSAKDAEEATLEFIKKHCKEKESPLCGNSVWQDRRFLRKYMPSIDQYLHYRIVDVSSFKEMIQRWYPRAKQAPKRENHLALDDIEDSIEELKFYRNHFFQKAEIPSND